MKHADREGPGVFSHFLQEKDIEVKTINLERNERWPSPRKFEAILIMGGPMSANDRIPAMLHELEALREALDAGVPCLGVCLGLQSLVLCSGGRAVRAPEPEVGFIDRQGDYYTVRLTEWGECSDLFRNFPKVFEVFQLHGEAVLLAAGHTLLATGSGTEVQAAQVAPRAFGVQFHLEMDLDMLGRWCREDGMLRSFDQEEIVRRFVVLRHTFERHARLLMLNFLDIAGL